MITSETIHAEEGMLERVIDAVLGDLPDDMPDDDAYPVIGSRLALLLGLIETIAATLPPNLVREISAASAQIARQMRDQSGADDSPDVDAPGPM